MLRRTTENYRISKLNIRHTFIPPQPPKIVCGYRVTVRWVLIPPEEAAARWERVLKILADSVFDEQVAKLRQARQDGAQESVAGDIPGTQVNDLTRWKLSAARS